MGNPMQIPVQAKNGGRPLPAAAKAKPAAAKSKAKPKVAPGTPPKELGKLDRNFGREPGKYFQASREKWDLGEYDFFLLPLS